MSAAVAGRRFKGGAHACLLTGLVRCAEPTKRLALDRSAYERSLWMADNPLNKISGMCIECT
ncbi:hypothetical protein L810_0092 [Burkholderia sp. AU4i]|nr:hypothetical protein L810_0092 [Burkholderia sp. AU4i]MDW9234187.1 hypothetical protein [Burkholderia cepacia]